MPFDHSLTGPLRVAFLWVVGAKGKHPRRDRESDRQTKEESVSFL